MDYYVIFRHLVIFGPATKEDAERYAHNTKVAVIKRQLAKWNNDSSTRTRSCDEAERQYMIESIRNVNFCVVDRDTCYESYSDAFEYYYLASIGLIGKDGKVKRRTSNE